LLFTDEAGLTFAGLVNWHTQHPCADINPHGILPSRHQQRLSGNVVVSIWKNVGDPVLDMRSDYIIPVCYHSKIFRVVIDRDYWKNNDPVFPADALPWFTDGSRTDSGTGSGISGIRPKRSFSFSLGKYATVFQTEIYVILQCACENIRIRL
jgi:hypothetical protein